MVMLAPPTEIDAPTPKHTHAPLGSAVVGWRTMLHHVQTDAYAAREGIRSGDVLTVRSGTPERSALVVAYVDGGPETLFRYLGHDGDRVRLAVLTHKSPPLRISASRVEIAGFVVGLHRSYRR